MSRNLLQVQRRFIQIGTNLTRQEYLQPVMDVWPPLKGREVSLQRARPWSSEKSNKAADNMVSLRELFLNRKVAFFAIPAPFTGTCTTEHVPGYQALADQFYAKGVNEIICYSVACPYALLLVCSMHAVASRSGHAGGTLTGMRTLIGRRRWALT